MADTPKPARPVFPVNYATNDAAENRSQNYRPTNPQRHLGHDGRIDVLPRERQFRQRGENSIVMRSPTGAFVSAHGQIHHDQHRDARRKCIGNQNPAQRAPSRERHQSCY